MTKDKKFSNEECQHIKDATNMLGTMSGYMTDELCRTDEGKVIKFSRERLDREIEDINNSILNLERIFNKRCEFIPSEEGLSVIFGGGTSKAKR